MEQRIKIVVIDDHPLMRTGICAILGLQPDMEVAGEFGDATSAIAHIDIEKPDLILMDLRLPGLGGVEAISIIHAKYPEIGILVLTTYEGDENIHQALQAGASAYIIKGMKPERLLQGIRRLALGRTYLPPEVSRVVASRSPDELSVREREVLLLVAEGCGNREIAMRLGISEKTVKSHVGMILARFEVTDRTKAVLVAIRRGYVRL